MNNDRRAAIRRAMRLLDEAKDILETCASDERDYFDNMPESLQDGERGQAASDAADALDEAVEAIDNMDLEQVL